MFRIVLFLITVLVFALPAQADTYTTNYNFTKPSSGSSGWDAKLNSNFDSIDTAIAAVDAKTGYVISGGAASPTTPGASYYSTLTGQALTGQAASTVSTRSVCPVAGTARSLYVKAGTNTLNGATVFTVRKNGVDQALTVTVTAGSTAIFSDTTNTFSVAAGDQLEIKADGTASGSGVMTNATWGIVITP